MGWDVSTTTESVARKDYHCEASDWISNRMSYEEMTHEERALWDKAADEKFKILKGRRHIKVSGFWDGEPSVFRARPELDDICRKYELYTE